MIKSNLKTINKQSSADQHQKNPNQFNGELIDQNNNSTKSIATKKLYLESYGCQMNFSDSEIVASLLNKEGFDTTKDITKADLVF